MNTNPGRFNFQEATIVETACAIEAGDTTSVQLTEELLRRIETYDRGEDGLNSTPVLNPEALAEAAASDRRSKDSLRRPLEGIPFTVKDSFMVEGLTVSAGSPAFESLEATSSAFLVEQLRRAGAVLVGKTNMPPMAAGGMQRGVYGRPESPYNKDYLPAAFGSGSSSGSAVSVAANLSMFSLGTETLCSGRSPASNNAVCAYTPSWGVISCRGVWPLFPTRDVVVPYTRTMEDMLYVLDVITQDDPDTRGDFWRDQQVISASMPATQQPASYLDLVNPNALAGKRLAVPAMYLGKDPSIPIKVRPSIQHLWETARKRLEDMGAIIVETEFPLIEMYEGGRPARRFVEGVGSLPKGWTELEFRDFLAYAWDDFLKANGDPNYPSLADVRPELIFPQPEGSLPNRYEYSGRQSNPYFEAVELARQGIQAPSHHPNFEKGLQATVELREELLENWMKEYEYDAIVFPTNADVGAANSDVDQASADHAWSNGVAFSHGNYAIRHLGIPTVTVPMGITEDIGMPVGLTFAGESYSDASLLSYATAFETGGERLRRAPALF